MLKIISERNVKFYDSEEEENVENSKEEDGNNKKTSEESENELVLLNFFEQRLQYILLSLTKLIKNRTDLKKG